LQKCTTLANRGERAHHVAMAVVYYGTRLAVAATAAVALAIPWYLVAHMLGNAKPAAASPVAPSAIVWGGRVFTDPNALRHWLHVRGVAYSVWGGRHTKARATLSR
jgi:hypothetical protein